MVFRFGREDESEQEWLANLRMERVLSQVNISSEKFSAMVSEWNESNPDRKVKLNNNSSLGLSQALVKSFFEVPVRAILDKVREVMEKAKEDPQVGHIDRLLLTGGFSNSHVLRKEFEKESRALETELVYSTLLWPTHTIAHGAVLFGAGRSVFGSRMSKFHYGIETSTTLNPATLKSAKLTLFNRQQEGTPQSHKMFKDDCGNFRKKLFEEVVSAGDPLVVGRPSLTLICCLSDQQKDFTIKILVTSKANVKCAHDPSMRTLCECRVNVEEAAPQPSTADGGDAPTPKTDKKYEVHLYLAGTETLVTVFESESMELVDDVKLTFPPHVHWLPGLDSPQGSEEEEEEEKGGEEKPEEQQQAAGPEKDAEEAAVAQQQSRTREWTWERKRDVEGKWKLVGIGISSANCSDES